MARANRKATTGRGTAEQIVSGAIGAAEALTVGVVQMTGRTLVETLRPHRGRADVECQDLGHGLLVS